MYFWGSKKNLLGNDPNHSKEKLKTWNVATTTIDILTRNSFLFRVCSPKTAPNTVMHVWDYYSSTTII